MAFLSNKRLLQQKKVTGRPIKVIASPRRPGDPPALVGSGEKAKYVLGWQPKYPDLESIITHAWRWHCQRHSPVVIFPSIKIRSNSSVKKADKCYF